MDHAYVAAQAYSTAKYFETAGLAVLIAVGSLWWGRTFRRTGRSPLAAPGGVVVDGALSGLRPPRPSASARLTGWALEVIGWFAAVGFVVNLGEAIFYALG
ncbi:hypothetical protein [Streptomyces sp. NPDC049040]|uniref:hypothetical protein n=1 Tax=Streptomyces sp. NPDC049040 TaxID=3365593 RepID=UPI003719A509